MNEWVWSNGGMILTGENCNTGRKTLYSVGGRWMNEYGAMLEWYWQAKTAIRGEKHYTASVADEWMSMENWWNDNHRRKKEVRGEKPVPVLLYPPQIPLRLTWERTHLSAVKDRLLTVWEECFTQMWQVCLCGISHNHLYWFISFRHRTLRWRVSRGSHDAT